MINDLRLPLLKFRQRSQIVLLVLCVLGVGAKADDAPKLDANGRKIYEAILDSQPIEITDDGTGFGYILERVTGHPRYEQPPDNGSVAEVIYDFKVPTGSKELRLKFLIYPDAKSASLKLKDSDILFVQESGMSEGDMASGFTMHADEPFEKEQHGQMVKNLIGDQASVLFVYQVERIIIISKTDAKFPGVVIRDSDKLEQFTHNEAKAMIGDARVLLAQGKIELAQPEIKALLH